MTRKRVTLNAERVQHWLGVGAQPTDRVLRFLDAAGLKTREARNNPERAVPGKKATERAEARAKAAEAAAAAAPGRRSSGRRSSGRRVIGLAHRPETADGPHRCGPWHQGRGAHPVLHRRPDGARGLWPAGDRQARADRSRSTPRALAGNVLVARLKGVADRTAAEKLNGVELFVDRDKLPPDRRRRRFLPRRPRSASKPGSTDGTVLGKVTAVPNFGAGDLLEVRDPRSGDTYLYPFTKRRRAGDPPQGRLPRHRSAHRGRAGRGGARLSFAADVITLFPELFPGPLGASVIGRGMGEGLWSLKRHPAPRFRHRQAPHRRRHAGRRRRRAWC